MRESQSSGWRQKANSNCSYRCCCSAAAAYVAYKSDESGAKEGRMLPLSFSTLALASSSSSSSPWWNTESFIIAFLFYSLPILLNEKEEIIIEAWRGVACGFQVLGWNSSLHLLCCHVMMCCETGVAQQQLDSFCFNDVVRMTNDRLQCRRSSLDDPKTDQISPFFFFFF